ncbi:predicted protein [Naegleria gruberi]|uniref:Predicted protein n=1 Tax=Naegleria gruberi TaxID=5762 RepID=D2VY03_NAEGR|nr:uncharacterized protein NAEGRDRAFT_81652 [Naegleria gruberi]EFC38238.1 predicted protein [Naegleria gruberi]|eukprot:XP_002670982.1 predicted protein [Naegleria gruberi strain NEG-M]
MDDAPQSKPALELPRLDFDTPKPPASPTDMIRRSREMALKEDMDLFHHGQKNYMDDDDDMAMINSIEEQNTFMTDSIDQNGTIDWKKEAGMMKQRQRRNSVDMPVVEEEEDMVLMNEDEEKNPSEEVIAEQLTFMEEETPTNTDKQKFQFNQLLQHLNSEVEYSDKTKKKKKKKHKNKDHDRIQSPRVRENREESDVIEEDPSMTITTDQQLSLQPNDGAKVIIELDELLGIGAHGKVYKGFIPNYITNTKDPVAIKKLSVKAGRFSKKFIKLEVDILKQLYHPYLVQYLGCKYSSKLKEYSIVLEYVDGGTLEHFIKTSGPMDERTVSVVVSQVLMGLEYLHSKRIIHRDLKPANILISGKGVVKITDFGVSAQLLNIEAIRTSCVGTPHYSAPEVIMVKPYSFTADIWSLGCVVFELLFGKRPYDEFNQVAAMYHMVKDDKPPMPTPNNLSPVCLDFIDKCWTKDWKKRPTARELQTHPFVNNNEHVIQKFVKNMRQSLIMPNNLLSQQTN